MPVYKAEMEGEAALRQFLREKSKSHVRWHWEAARAYRTWKSRGRVRWHWKRHVRVQVLEVEEAMVLELSLPKPGGHVLSP
jgi:hypothetical protein